MSSRPRLLDTPVTRAALRYASRANTWIYRRTDGCLGGRGPGRAPVCNLVTDRSVEVRIGRTTRATRARTADESERAALWPRLTALYKGYDNYQGWTVERTIPVVICEPEGAA